MITTINEFRKTIQNNNRINEGCWALPFTVEKATQLKSMIDSLRNDPDYVFGSRDHMGGHGVNTNKSVELYDLMGCDGLFDQLIELTADKDNMDNNKIADAIVDTVDIYVKSYEEKTSNFYETADEEALKILKTLK